MKAPPPRLPELLLLGAIWGSSFLFLRISAPALGSFPLVALRLALGALVLLPFAWPARAALAPRRLPLVAAIALVNSALPFMLFAWAAPRLPAGVSAIANGSAVLFTALAGGLFFGESIGGRRFAALLVGFAGVLLLTGGRGGHGGDAGEGFGLAAAAAVGASMCYGLGAHLVRRHLAGLPPAVLGCAALGSSALLLAPLAWAQWPAEPVPPSAWAAALVLGLLCTGAAYALYYRLLAQVGPSRSAAVAYLVPVFGVGWAWLLLGEPLTPSMALAGALILGSVAASQRAA